VGVKFLRLRFLIVFSGIENGAQNLVHKWVKNLNVMCVCVFFFKNCSTVSSEEQKTICVKGFERRSAHYTKADNAFQCVKELFNKGTCTLLQIPRDVCVPPGCAVTAFSDVITSLHEAFLDYDHMPWRAFVLASQLFEDLMYYKMSPDMKAMVFLVHDFVQPLASIVAKRTADGQDTTALNTMLTMLRMNIEILKGFTASDLEMLRESGKVVCARATQWSDGDVEVLSSALISNRGFI
jgi:hypothetical protein